MLYQTPTTPTIKALFNGWEEKETIISSCLHQTMGAVYTTNPDQPKSAAAILGDFCFLAGQPDEELILTKPDGRKSDFIIMVPQNEAWAALIEEVLGKHQMDVPACAVYPPGSIPAEIKKTSRYAIKKEPEVFDTVRLRNIVNSLPPEYVLRQIDEPIYHACLEQEWCRDLVAQYGDYADYQKKGLGFVILRDTAGSQTELLSGASSYSSYPGGIEIEIDTALSYRRQGLALICGAKLILECLSRGLYPSWDAQNSGSVALSEKLGYHFDYEYTVYEVYGY